MRTLLLIRSSDRRNSAHPEQRRASEQRSGWPRRQAILCRRSALRACASTTTHRSRTVAHSSAMHTAVGSGDTPRAAATARSESVDSDRYEGHSAETLSSWKRMAPRGRRPVRRGVVPRREWRSVHIAGLGGLDLVLASWPKPTHAAPSKVRGGICHPRTPHAHVEPLGRVSAVSRTRRTASCSQQFAAKRLFCSFLAGS